MKLGLVLLLLLGGVAAAGSFLPAQQDFYRSPNFRILLAVLALNLGICSLKRVRTVAAVFKRKLKLLFEKIPTNVPLKESLTLKLGWEKTIDSTRHLLQQYRFQVAEVKNQEESSTIMVQLGKLVPVPGTDYKIYTYRYDEKDSKIIYALYKGGSRAGVGAAGISEVIQIKEGVSFSFNGNTRYTGLKVKTDPGVPVVWAGSGLLLAGIIMSLYWRPRFLWIVIKDEDKRVSCCHKRTFCFYKHKTGNNRTCCL